MENNFTFFEGDDLYYNEDLSQDEFGNFKEPTPQQIEKQACQNMWGFKHDPVWF